MSDAETRIQARKDKLLRAAGIIKRYLDCPKELKGLEMSNEMLLRMGMGMRLPMVIVMDRILPAAIALGMRLPRLTHVDATVMRTMKTSSIEMRLIQATRLRCE